MFIMQKDKKKHFIFSAVASFPLGLINPIYGVCFGAGLGLGKEYGDMMAEGNVWSWGDIIADALGILAGAVLAVAVRLIGGYFYG